jgi:hypothetical protein
LNKDRANSLKENGYTYTELFVIRATKDNVVKNSGGERLSQMMKDRQLTLVNDK